MKLFAILFVCLQSIVATQAFGGVTGPSKSPRTLLQAIATAVKNNPKTKAIDELLEAISLSTQAAQTYRLPRGYISCSVNRDYQNGSYNGLPLPPSTSTSGNCSVGASITVYDGGAGRYRAKSAQASEEAARASFNTADSLIPNTRGGLANSTQAYFSSIARMDSYLDFYSRYLAVLKEFKTFENDDNLVATISNLEQELIQFENNRQIAISNFKYVVTVEPSPDIDGFDEAIQSLTIPSTAEEAIEIATTRGPEVIRRNLNVQMAQFNLQAERASHGPLITLNGQVTSGRYRVNSEYDSRSTYTSKGVGVTLTIPIDPSSGYRIRAAEKTVISERLQRDGALADAEHQVRRTYKSIANNHRLYIAYKQSLDDQWNYVNGIVKKIQAHNTTGLNIDDMLTSASILSQRHSQLLELQSQILLDVFSIQQVTGILFENIDAEPEIKMNF